MDSLTQAVLGAGIGGAMLGRFHGRKAVAAGALLATLPDLDVVIRYADPVSAMINHRGFSHSVFVLTAASALLAWAVRRCAPRRDYGPWLLFLAIWLMLVTHPLLDAFTSYGTQLFWPLRPTPTSWSSIFIIDPFFTVPLTLAVLAALAFGAGSRARRAMAWALAWCAAYLALSIAFKHIIEARVRESLQREGVRVQALFSTPEPFNILLWRVAARDDGDHYHEAIAGLLDTGPGERIRLPLNSALAGAVPDSHWLDGLRWFSGDWLRYDEIDRKLVVSDLRMGLGAGYYSFRFLMAERGADGAWTAVTPSMWPGRRGLDELGAVLRRVWRQSPPLPQQRWEARMRGPAAP